MKEVRGQISRINRKAVVPIQQTGLVWDQAKKSGVSLGQLMTIASIKFFEFAQHLQEMKDRIV